MDVDAEVEKLPVEKNTASREFWRKAVVALPLFRICTPLRPALVQWGHLASVYADATFHTITLEVQYQGVYLLKSEKDSLEELFMCFQTERVFSVSQVERALRIQFVPPAKN